MKNTATNNLIKEKFSDFDTQYFQKHIKHLLPHYQRNFTSLEFDRGLQKYIDRALNIGLNDRGLILDAGGGVGNWAIALASLNQQVEVIDVSAERLFVGYLMAKRMNKKNIEFQNASIENIPYKSNHFDAIICYSVIMFTNVEKSLSEFYRVLKPNGRLYIQADLWRWYFRQAIPRKPTHLTNFILKKTLLGKPVFFTIKKTIKKIETAGFNIVSFGQDGYSSFNTNLPKVISFYPKKENGKEELIEICAIKPDK